jgi:hypothetical protein
VTTLRSEEPATSRSQSTATHTTRSRRWQAVGGVRRCSRPEPARRSRGWGAPSANSCGAGARAEVDALDGHAWRRPGAADLAAVGGPPSASAAARRCDTATPTPSTGDRGSSGRTTDWNGVWVDDPRRIEACGRALCRTGAEGSSRRGPAIMRR